MSKTWQTRLNDTIRKVRDEQGDAVGDILQGLVDGLPDDAKERISRDLSLGWRIWWNRGAQETENRRVRRANALTDRIVGELPPLATAVGEAVRQIPLNSVKELELRLLAPAQFYMGFIGSAVGEQQTTEYQYRWALANTWANSCGGFSAVLKDVISAHWDTVLDTMRAATADGGRHLHWFETDIVDAQGDVVARVRKQVYARRKRER